REQRPRDNAQRQLRHVGAHVARLALAHLAAQTLLLLDHDPGVAGDPAAVERRLHHPPLAQVEVALTCEQAVTEHDPRSLESRALLERFLTSDQHLADEVGTQYHVDVLWPDTEVDQIAVVVVQPGHHGCGVVVQAGHDAEGAERAGPGRKSVAAVQVRYCRDPLATLQPRQGVPWWLRAYLLV